MPILPNAKKALRTSKRKADFNQQIKSRVHSAVKNMEKNKTEAALKSAYSVIDKAVKKNLFHRNKAARLKAKMAKLVTQTKSKLNTKTVTKPKTKVVKKKSVIAPKATTVKKTASIKKAAVTKKATATKKAVSAKKTTKAKKTATSKKVAKK